MCVKTDQQGQAILTWGRIVHDCAGAWFVHAAYVPWRFQVHWVECCSRCRLNPHLSRVGTHCASTKTRGVCPNGILLPEDYRTCALTTEPNDIIEYGERGLQSRCASFPIDKLVARVIFLQYPHISVDVDASGSRSLHATGLDNVENCTTSSWRMSHRRTCRVLARNTDFATLYVV